MAQLDLARASVLAAVAALALTGCGGGLMVTDAPSRSAKAEARHAEVEGRSEVTGHSDVRRAAQGDRAELREARSEAAVVEPKADLDASDAPHDAPYYVAPETAKAIDLEFSDGLPAPTQEQVVTPPAPWRPAALAGAQVAANPQIDDVWPNKGPESGGGVVVIKGKNLMVTQVLFGMMPARILEATSDAVKVAIPGSGAGEVPVVITNGDGTYAVAMHAFRYYR